MKKAQINLPHRSPISIATDCLHLWKLLSLNYGEYFDSNSYSSTANSLFVTRHDKGYKFCSPDSSYLTEHPLAEIDRYLFDNSTYSSEIFALHGAAVEWKGSCHVFLAPTTSGKTTLTSYLTNYGFGYLTDDCVLLDRQKFQIYPCTTPIHLREGGLAVLKAIGVTPNDLQLMEESQLSRRFVYTPSTCVKIPIPIANIYFIRRTEDQNLLIPMGTTERMTELMKSPITDYPLTSDYLRFLSRLARVNCYRLYYRDMNFVKEMIQHESYIHV